jgi:hypothetical protein
MDIINVEAPSDPSSLKFRIGGAMFFEKVGKWKHHFRNLIVRNDTRLIQVTLLTLGT